MSKLPKLPMNYNKLTWLPPPTDNTHNDDHCYSQDDHHQHYNHYTSYYSRTEPCRDND